MSKYGIVIIVVLLVALFGVVAWQMAVGEDDIFSGQKKEAQVLTVPGIESQQIDLEINIEKDSYYESEQANIEVIVGGQLDEKNLLLEVVGITDKFGDDYVDEKKVVDITAGDKKMIEISKRLPNCTPCEGFKEGRYIVEAIMYRDSFELGRVQASFELKEK